jgi:hypothetical protein
MQRHVLRGAQPWHPTSSEAWGRPSTADIVTISPVSRKRLRRPLRLVVLGRIPVYSAVCVSLRPDCSDIVGVVASVISRFSNSITCLFFVTAAKSQNQLVNRSILKQYMTAHLLQKDLNTPSASPQPYHTPESPASDPTSPRPRPHRPPSD